MNQNINGQGEKQGQSKISSAIQKYIYEIGDKNSTGGSQNIDPRNHASY